MKRNERMHSKFLACLTLMLSLLSCLARAEDPSDKMESRNKLPLKQHKTSNAPFLTPAEAVKQMAIPEGFEVSIYASEPDIAEPIGFCFDHKGRLWVAENFNYRTRRNHTNDPVSRIQILEDTDGDGVFDKKKTFTDTLTFTSGLAVGFGGIYVGSPPNLTFIPDADGDDVPDGPPRVLLDGWGINDRHETLNSFIWGPDGWLYGCHGVFTESMVGKPGDDDSARQFIDGGIWRYHPTRDKFEIFARGLSNPWGFDFNDHGQSFTTCCVIPHLFHIVLGGVYHKQSKPHVNPYIYDDIKTIRTHTHLSAHGGARVYLADTFPQKYRDRLFMCNIHEHAVLTDILEPKGSTFIGKEGDDFLPTNDMAWVGFSVETGPEGGIYILDWHDTDVCGNQVNFPNSGRIYRIMPKGVPASATPDLTKMTDAQLVELQWNSNDWYVRHARTLLQSRAHAGKLDMATVVKQLTTMMQRASSSPKRLRALWALYSIGALETQDLVTLLDHDDKYVRSWSIQFLCDASPLNAFQDASAATESVVDATILAKFAEMARSDASPVVRLYLASAAQRLAFKDRWEVLAGLLSHSEDIGDNNLPRMYWFALEPMVPKNQAKALKLAVTGKIPAIQGFVAKRMATGNQPTPTKPIKTPRNSKNWQQNIQAVAPEFKVADVGEGGVVKHSAFRNRVAVQTHPLDRKTPSRLTRSISVPNGKSELQLSVSHHPHGDWQLRVLASIDKKQPEVIFESLVSSKTVGDNEWLDVEVDLSKFAGQKVQLTLENRANNWANEWAYWHKVKIVGSAGK